MIRRDQQGFSVIDGMIVLVVVIVLGLGYWLVVARHTSNNQVAAPVASDQGPAKTYNDSASIYTLAYPSSWTLKEAANCCEGPEQHQSKVSRAITLVPPNPPNSLMGYGVLVQADKTGALAASIRMNWMENGHASEREVINGYPTEYVVVDFSTGSEQYTDRDYLITSEGKTVYVSFRQKWNHPMGGASWDASAYTDQFMDIVRSVTFIK